MTHDLAVSDSKDINGKLLVMSINSNPSAFATYASVRSIVLSEVTRSLQNLHSNSISADGSDSEDELSDDARDNIVPLSKLVGFGLVSVYELINGSKSTHPALCIRVLEAFLDILQGQQPEALRNEPSHVISSLFQILLHLSTSENGSSQDEFLKCSELSGIACSCLFALVVARGDPALYLRALSDILISSRHLSVQTTTVPIILTMLQRSVQAVLIGKLTAPQWFSVGIPTSSCIDMFSVNIKMEQITSENFMSLTCDGHYLYFYTSQGIYKIGTGYGGTRKGHIYLHKNECYPKKINWIGYAENELYYRSNHSKNSEITSLDRETLKTNEILKISGDVCSNGVAFIDGLHLGYILADKDNEFVVRSYDLCSKPMKMIDELKLSLSVRCLQAFGNGEKIHKLCSGLDEDVKYLGSGKDFSLLCTNSGKLHYTGKASALGQKNNPSARSNNDANVNCNLESKCNWPELFVCEGAVITQFFVGHDGHHAILLSEEGAAYFVGTSKRGEDGDSGKMRRQNKSCRPKRMANMEGEYVVNAAVNHATTALVTRQGELYMFGKDTAYVDTQTGLVTELQGIPIQSVALGKAHAVALTSKGFVYTFGINNKGQCGREYRSPPKELAVPGDQEDAYEEVAENEADLVSENNLVMCPNGTHRFYKEMCLICVLCNECTGYGAACISKNKSNRHPGSVCGCGSGESGCAECGACRTCTEGADDLGKSHDKLSKPTHRENKTAADSFTSAVDADKVKICSLSPALLLTIPYSVNQVSCGLHHTVALVSNGQVYCWGSNSHGQLGRSKVDAVVTPKLVRLPDTVTITQVAAGNNHTVLLASDGSVYTFGAYRQEQLGRTRPKSDASEWYCKPTCVPTIGPRYVV